ncbi:MAG: hypothetical protein ACRD4R_08655 [Candidatus Acidiferrales bacterium]
MPNGKGPTTPNSPIIPFRPNPSGSASTSSNAAGNPLIPELFSQFDQDGQTAPAASPTTSSATSPEPLMANVGGQWVPIDPRAMAGMHVDPKADLKTVLGYMPQIGAGPYAGGADATGSVYRKQLATPYVTALAQTIGQHHPGIASAIDGGLLAASGAEQAMERSDEAGGGTSGWGAGLAAVGSGLQYQAQAPLARRQQLENVPLAYQQQQAQLAESKSGVLRNLMTAVNQYESNPARILSQVGRNALSAGIGAQSRLQMGQQNNAAKTAIDQQNNANRLQIALNSDATKTTIAHLQSQYRSANPQQRALLYTRFAQGLDAHIGQINARFDKLEHSPVIDPVSMQQRQRTPDEIAQLETERQSEIGAELEFGDEASQRAFGHPMMEAAPQTQQPASSASPASSPAPFVPSRSRRARGSRTPAVSGAPPASLLKPGVITHFANGQSWMLQNGQPVRTN